MQTEAGEQYGPITRTELDQWYADGRVDATCQVLSDEWDQWKWAEEVFPDLGDGAVEEVVDNNPFAGIGDAAPQAAQADPNPFPSPQVTSPQVTSPQGPVAPPVAEGATQSPQSNEEVDPRVQKHLAATYPWVLFLAIVGFVGGGLGLVGGLIAIVVGISAISRSILPLLQALIMLLSTGVGLVNAFLLLQYASQIKRFLKARDGQSLARAMIAQKNLFMFMGISVAALFAIFFIFVLIVIVAGMAVGGAVRF